METVNINSMVVSSRCLSLQQLANKILPSVDPSYICNSDLFLFDKLADNCLIPVVSFKVQGFGTSYIILESGDTTSAETKTLGELFSIARMHGLSWSNTHIFLCRKNGGISTPIEIENALWDKESYAVYFEEVTMIENMQASPKDDSAPKNHSEGNLGTGESFNDGYTQEELDDMYRSAYEGEADAEWNTD